MTENLRNSTTTTTGTLSEARAKGLRNLLVVLAAIALSVALFWGLRTETSSITVGELAEEATPLEVAVANGKPSLMEFYANWCTSCQAMAPDLKEIKEEYGQQLNFVMLNVDNNKWLPELVKYRVDGIPHFVFLDSAGTAIAQTIGELPRPILEANLQALIAGETLPYAHATGQTSQFNPSVTPAAAKSTDPRAHGAQVR
jgi:thiol-disulfide isomerase/thioredoxin